MQFGCKMAAVYNLNERSAPAKKWPTMSLIFAYFG
jgi:hypothetical protein